MGQATAVSATTDERRWFSALRPLIVLGGFVLVWWFLMTGAAQAAGGPDRDLADTAREVTGNVERVVDREVRHSAPADRVRQQHRAPDAEVTRTVGRHVDPVVSPVATPVASVAKETVENNVTAVTTRTTDTVRSTVRKVVGDVPSGLEKGTAVVPELNPDEHVVPPRKAAVSPTRVGETGSNETRTPDFQKASSMLPSAAAVAALRSPAATFDAPSDPTVTSGQDTAIPTPADGLHSDGAASPADHDGASSVLSGNGGLVAADQNAQALLKTPSASSTSTVMSVDRLPAGPAYPPASSPD